MRRPTESRGSQRSGGVGRYGKAGTQHVVLSRGCADVLVSSLDVVGHRQSCSCFHVGASMAPIVDHWQSQYGADLPGVCDV